jgi:hypothetical protein
MIRMQIPSNRGLPVTTLIKRDFELCMIAGTWRQSSSSSSSLHGMSGAASHCAALAAHKGKSNDLAGKNPGSLLVIHDLRR